MLMQAYSTINFPIAEEKGDTDMANISSKGSCWNTFGITQVGLSLK